MSPEEEEVWCLKKDAKYLQEKSEQVSNAGEFGPVCTYGYEKGHGWHGCGETGDCIL